MKATARLMVLLTVLWGGGLAIQGPVFAGYLEGEAARVFLQQKAPQRRGGGGDVRAVYETPVGGRRGISGIVPLYPYRGPRGRVAVVAVVTRGPPAPLDRGPRPVPVRTAGVSGPVVGVSEGTFGSSHVSSRGVRTSWRYGPPARGGDWLVFSNRGFLGFGTGRFQFATR